MAEWSFIETKKDGVVSIREFDWGMALSIEFNFSDFKIGFLIPKDITEEELGDGLEKVISGLRQKKDVFIIPYRYHVERQKELKRILTEEQG